MTKTRVLVGGGVFVAIALLAGIGWLATTRSCTRIGCQDAVGYGIPVEAYAAWGIGEEAPVVVETCVDDDCRSAEWWLGNGGACCRVRGEEFVISDAFALDRVYVVTLEVTDPQGMVRYARTDSGIRLERTQPNGPNCSPTCLTWYLELTLEDLGL